MYYKVFPSNMSDKNESYNGQDSLAKQDARYHECFSIFWILANEVLPWNASGSNEYWKGQNPLQDQDLRYHGCFVTF